jgi:hypothetical protein
MHRMNRPLFRLSAGFVVLAALGCTITIDGSGDGSQPPPGTAIRVFVVNDTTKPLDAEMFVGSIANGLDHLFDAANKRTDFGIGNIGILDAAGQGSFTITCADPVFIGTQGGAFGDDLRNPSGHGEQFVLQEGLSVRCGDTVTFVFTAAGNTLQVGVAVEPR